MPPAGPDITVRRVTGEALAHCFAVRRAVFIDEQGICEADEYDGEDDACRHLLALRAGTPVGTARLATRGHRLKVQRVCVLKAHRGAGIGEALMTAAIDEARRTPAITEVTLGAQLQALAFYERLGFTPHGEIYQDAAIPHRHMTLLLSE